MRIWFAFIGNGLDSPSEATGASEHESDDHNEADAAAAAATQKDQDEDKNEKNDQSRRYLREAPSIRDAPLRAGIGIDNGGDICTVRVWGQQLVGPRIVGEWIKPSEALVAHDWHWACFLAIAFDCPICTVRDDFAQFDVIALENNVPKSPIHLGR